MQNKEYFNLYNIDKYSNYKNKTKKHNINNSKELSEYIYNNYSTMDEIEIRKIAAKVLDINEAKSILLNYELCNYKRDSVNNLTLEEFEKEANKLLSRYQCKAGGFCIEDTVWTVYRHDNNDYDVKKSELLFENTVSFVDSESAELTKYINKILKQLDNLSDNISVNYREYKKKKSKVLRLHIWAVDKNIIDDSSDESIGL